MKRIVFFGLLIMLPGLGFAQGYEIAYDYQHLASVTANAAVRSGAETTHGDYLGKISANLNDLNINAGSVALAQIMIYQALSNVNSALRGGMTVKNMAVIIADMTTYISQALAMAKAQPYLLLTAGNIASEMKTRALALVSDVSAFILKQGDNVLADYNARDQLLHKVTQELQILDGLAYGAWKAMYWARERGIIASPPSPFAAFVNRDKSIVAQIIQNAKYLKQ